MTFSISGEPPEFEPLDWRWGGPKPDGYNWPNGRLTIGLTLTCGQCGAAVTPDATKLHDVWHERVNGTLP